MEVIRKTKVSDPFTSGPTGCSGSSSAGCPSPGLPFKPVQSGRSNLRNHAWEWQLSGSVTGRTRPKVVLPRFRGHMRAWVTSEFRLSQHWLRRSEGPDRSRACLSSCRQPHHAQPLAMLLRVPEVVLCLLVQPTLGGGTKGDRKAHSHLRADASSTVQDGGESLAADAEGLSRFGHRQA